MMRKSPATTADKQLVHLQISKLTRKRALDQALNIKEFARLAAISYSLARSWLCEPGFPAIGGVVFWQDFVQWRQARSGLTEFLDQVKRESRNVLSKPTPGFQFTGKAARILLE